MLSVGRDAGGVLEVHVGVLLGRRLHRVAEAERGGEDDLVAVLDEVLDDLRGLGPLGDVLLVGGLDGVAELLLDVLAAVVVGRCPAAVVDRADVDPGRLERLAGAVAASAASGRRLGSRLVARSWPRPWLPRWLADAAPSSSSSSPHAASSSAPTASTANGARRVMLILMDVSFQGSRWAPFFLAAQPPDDILA